MFIQSGLVENAVVSPENVQVNSSIVEWGCHTYKKINKKKHV